MAARMPSIYLPHGGGPWPFVDLGFDAAEMARLTEYLRGIPGMLPATPRALLVVSAHWEAPVPTVMSAPRPPMLYDYYGFPEAAYHVTWPAPGDPALAERVRGLLGAAGIESADAPTRGFDHGTFVPMKLSYPRADIPTTQLSLIAGLDPAAHLALGRALSPLRDEGVLIVGSGMSFHNMQVFGQMMRAARSGADGSTGAAWPPSAEFDAWLQQAVTLPAAERDARLRDWTRAPAARASHPREEHLLPLMVAAGAAGDDPGSIPYADQLMGTRVLAAHFGSPTTAA